MEVRESPLILSADLFPDMSVNEMAYEIEMMFRRSQAIHDAISGKIPVREMVDIVEDSGIDIDQWAITCDQVSGMW
ncbi:MAG: hypothetical protein ACK5RE_18005 [Pseudanabaena sp.]|jgi:hypothetical protein